MEKKKLVRFSLEDWQANPKRKVVTDAGKENEYELYVKLSNEVKEASYMRMGQKGIEASARVPLKEGTTYAEIQEWAENIERAML